MPVQRVGQGLARLVVELRVGETLLDCGEARKSVRGRSRPSEQEREGWTHVG